MSSWRWLVINDCLVISGFPDAGVSQVSRHSKQPNLGLTQEFVVVCAHAKRHSKISSWETLALPEICSETWSQYWLHISVKTWSQYWLQISVKHGHSIGCISQLKYGHNMAAYLSENMVIVLAAYLRVSGETMQLTTILGLRFYLHPAFGISASTSACRCFLAFCPEGSREVLCVGCCVGFL